MCGIRYSTAKTILKIFKREGRTEKKKKRVKKNLKCNSGKRVSASEEIVPESNHMVKEDEATLQRKWSLDSTLPDGYWAEQITSHMQGSV